MKIHHIGYLVKNLKESEKQFLELGGKIESTKKFDPIRNANIEFLLNDGCRIELIEPVDETSELYPLLKKYRNQAYHICYITNNINKSINQ